MKVSYQVSEFDDRILLLKLEDELTIGDCETISQVFKEIIDQEKYYIIALMDKVSFVSSPFLGKLMGCKLHLKEKGGNLVMMGLSYPLREKLFMMGANKVFHFFSDIQTAYNYYHWDLNETAQNLSLNIPPNLGNIPAVRRLISGIAKQKDYSPKDCFRIETIVDEVGNNAIEHGDPTQSSIQVHFCINKKMVEITIKNKTLVKEVETMKSLIDNDGVDNSAEDEFRGRGIALVKLISNSIDFKVDDTGTSVKVIKKREQK